MKKLIAILSVLACVANMAALDIKNKTNKDIIAQVAYKINDTSGYKVSDISVPAMKDVSIPMEPRGLVIINASYAPNRSSQRLIYVHAGSHVEVTGDGELRLFLKAVN